MKKRPNIWEASPKNIWNYKQNHPELVIRDITEFGNEYMNISQIQNLIRQSMLCRGINKWLKVRRDLIAYKKGLKHEIKDLQKQIIELKKDLTESFINIDFKSDYIPMDVFLKYQEYRKKQINYIKTKEILNYKIKVRIDLKALCMTERWQIWKGKELRDMNSIKCSD